MINFKKFMKSKTGKYIISALLGLGIAGLFKMSCDNRGCLVYKGPEFKEDKKVVQYNKKCYKAQEHMRTCNLEEGKQMILTA